jgi:hypothetical protein
MRYECVSYISGLHKFRKDAQWGEFRPFECFHLRNCWTDLNEIQYCGSHSTTLRLYGVTWLPDTLSRLSSDPSRTRAGPRDSVLHVTTLKQVTTFRFPFLNLVSVGHNEEGDY